MANMPESSNKPSLAEPEPGFVCNLRLQSKPCYCWCAAVSPSRRHGFSQGLLRACRFWRSRRGSWRSSSPTWPHACSKSYRTVGLPGLCQGYCALKPGAIQGIWS